MHGRSESHPWAAGLAAIDAPGIQEPALRGAALLLHARAAEGAGRTGGPGCWPGSAWRRFRACCPRSAMRAEYELCAGNWARAWELADSIRADAVAEPMLPAWAACGEPAAGTGQVSRNRPCPCGSGRKYKACCQEKDQQACRTRWPSGLWPCTR